MAQELFQMRKLWNDFKHEELQRIRQKTLLCCVSILFLLALQITGPGKPYTFGNTLIY